MTIRVSREMNCDGPGCDQWMRYEVLEIIWPGLQSEGWTKGRGKHYCPEHHHVKISLDLQRKDALRSYHTIGDRVL